MSLQVDCTAETKVCHDNEVKGYPTLKFFSPGFEPSKYNGKRDYASLEKFIEEKMSIKKVMFYLTNGKHCGYPLLMLYTQYYKLNYRLTKEKYSILEKTKIIIKTFHCQKYK